MKKNKDIYKDGDIVLNLPSNLIHSFLKGRDGLAPAYSTRLAKKEEYEKFMTTNGDSVLASDTWIWNNQKYISNLSTLLKNK